MSEDGRSRGATALLVLALATSAWSCSRNSSDSSTITGSVGPGGGVITVQQGALAGTSVELAPNALQQNAQIAIIPAEARNYPDLIAVGPAAMITPEILGAAATVTLVFDSNHPQVVANDPSTSLVVMRLDAKDRLRVLPTTSFDLAAGRVRTRTTDLGTMWVAVRPANAPFSLADFVPDEFNGYQYDSQYSLFVETPFADPNMAPGEWLGWHLAPPSFGLPSTFRRGIYVDYPTDGTILFGGAFSDVGLFIGSRWQYLAATPLTVPATVFEGEEYTNTQGIDVYTPFGSTTATMQNGGLTVRIGQRGAMNVPAGSFGDVVRVCFEVQFDGVPVYWFDVDLARGVGPIAYEELGLGGWLTRAYLQ